MKPHKLFISVLLITLVLFFGAGGISASTESEAREFKLKAAFMLNFSKFTTWPKEAAGQKGDTFNFCIIGVNPFGNALDGLESKKVGGRQVRLHFAKSIDEARNCNVLFISKSEKGNLRQLKQITDGRAILTISDIEGFSRNGGMFEFVSQGGRLSFVVNNQEVINNGLQVNASLLNLAAEVL